MSDEPDPLEPDILGLLQSAKKSTPVDAGARARVLAGVESRIAALPPGGGGGGNERGGEPGTPKPPPNGAGTSLGKLLASRPLTSLALALAVGGAAGALARGTPEPRTVYVDREVPVLVVPTATVAPAPAPTTAPSASAAIDVDSLPSSGAAPRASAPPLDAGAALAAESALLDVARTALARGEPDHALAAVGRHAAQFPHGALAEEREAIAVKALAQSGRGADARARADRFRTRYPESLFSTAIDSSLKDVRQMDSPRSPQP
jgi:hypothetical protein